jgi:hypothetical protein
VDQSQPLYTQLRAYWDAIRAYDYEALFEESPLEAILLTPDTVHIDRRPVLALRSAGPPAGTCISPAVPAL